MAEMLNGKVAIVTGSGRGIGRGIAKLMAAEGASVVVVDPGVNVDGSGQDQSIAEQVVAEIKAEGGNAIACMESVTEMEGGEKIVQTAVDNFGKLDIVVTCAGILRDRMIFNMSEAEWDDVIAVHLKGTFTVVKDACILMRQQRSGRIITFSSESGLMGNSGQANYGAAKSGIAGFTKVVAKDMGRYGVICNAISPMVETRLFPGRVEEFRVDSGPHPTRDERAKIGKSPEISDWTGPGEPDDPENVAPLAVYLCTDSLTNVNGYVFGIRGGSIFLYSNPVVESSINKWGTFTMDEMDTLVPKMFGNGF